MITLSQPRFGTEQRRPDAGLDLAVRDAQPVLSPQDNQPDLSEGELLYKEELSQFDRSAITKLAVIQRNPGGLGHELAAEYGKQDPYIQWLNQERKDLLRAELVNKHVEPKVSKKARELFHDLDASVRKTLQEHGYNEHGYRNQAARHPRRQPEPGDTGRTLNLLG